MTDAGLATMRKYTALPQKKTYLAHAFRALAGTLQGKEIREVWQPAQHSTGWSDLLALLNAKAHKRAQEALELALPYTIPLAELMDGALLLSRDGALILVPGANMDRVYKQEVVSRFYTDSRRSWARYDASLFRGLIEANELPTRAISRAMALRVLAKQAPPGDALIECHYCGTTTLWMDRHVAE